MAIVSLFLFLILTWNLGEARGNYLLAGKIQDGHIEREVFRIKAKAGSLLSIAYDHSLYQTPQKEIYTLQEGIFNLKEINFGKLEAACYYNTYQSGKFFRQGLLWKFLPDKPYPFSVLQIRIPFHGDFAIKLDNFLVWNPKDEHRGSLLILRILQPGF